MPNSWKTLPLPTTLPHSLLLSDQLLPAYTTTSTMLGLATKKIPVNDLTLPAQPIKSLQAAVLLLLEYRQISQSTPCYCRSRHTKVRKARANGVWMLQPMRTLHPVQQSIPTNEKSARASKASHPVATAKIRFIQLRLIRYMLYRRPCSINQPTKWTCPLLSIWLRLYPMMIKSCSHSEPENGRLMTNADFAANQWRTSSTKRLQVASSSRARPKGAKMFSPSTKTDAVV